MARNLVFSLQEAGWPASFLARDRDSKFNGTSDEVLRSEGTSAVRTPARAPRANCYAERWIGSTRAERFDHLLVFSRHQLERALRACVEHYNLARPHGSLQLEVPGGTAGQFPAGRVGRHDVLGGLVHEYQRAA